MELKTQKDITIEEGYSISLIFFYLLWFLIGPRVQEPENLKIINELFFFEVCMGNEASTEWKQAIFRAKQIPKEKIRETKISEEDLFLCAIEFCKIHNERWEGALNSTFLLLEAMIADLNHPEWKRWKEAMDAVLVSHMSCGTFDW